jgi:hypothetical protein
MKINYKKLFVFWVAIGIAVCGGLFIYTRSHPVIYADGSLAYYEKEMLFKILCLTTIVGAVLIGGLGFVSNSKD